MYGSFFMFIFFMLISLDAYSDQNIAKSSIKSVKLYQNQAEIERTAKLVLRKGVNKILLRDLPPLLFDWSVKGRLVKATGTKILSLEVSRNALTKRRQKRIIQIEAKLKKFIEQDGELLDDLKNLRSQERFLNSVLNFTNQTVSKELMTRIPKIEVWDNTLTYVHRKRKDLNGRKRRIERRRETIGKEIQKWEFRLSQTAGFNYFKNYQALNRSVLHNRAAMNIQQFDAITRNYAARDRLLRTPKGKVDFEKRVAITIYSPQEGTADLTLSYIIPQTHWKMRYDIRASRESKSLTMSVFANVYQRTGEDWNDIALSLSTGQPINSITPPRLLSWILDLPRHRRNYYAAGASGYRPSSAVARQKMDADREEDTAPAAESIAYRINTKGPNVEVKLPIEQSVASTTKYQKKYIRDFSLSNAKTKGKSVTFYYELMPARVKNSYLRVVAENNTSLPWLAGEAQIFLENEFMGKVRIPHTPVGKKQDLVLGVESRISSKKEMIEKFEDTSGIFGGNRRIKYRYKVTVSNDFGTAKEAIVKDIIPITRNKKIDVEIEGLSLPYINDKRTKESLEFAKGIRKWKMQIPANDNRSFTYDVIITFDEDVRITGLR